MKKTYIIGTVVVVLGLLIFGWAVPTLARNSGNNQVTSYSGAYLDQPTLIRLSQVLKLTPAELTGRLANGETLSAIAAKQGVSEEAVVAVIVAPHADQLNLRVNYGYITRQQADILLSQAQERARILLQQNLSTSTNDGSYSWEEMQEYCDDMMGSGGMMGNG
ncbi:MAG: hypothetical protein HYU83_05900, partial [Chloroflexi bacterium]|nr:hypothetical protein [Chloroflexota bacterium]